MKKIFAIMLALSMCLLSASALVACNGTEPSVTSDAEQSTAPLTDAPATDGTTSQAVEEYEPRTLKFSLFSDFHYKKYMYISSIEDMDTIIERAADNEVDFIMQTGDFCNDYKGSPELMNAYLENDYGIPAYGVYGNHELESADNSMAVVTPLITHDAESVVWGTYNGKIGDGSIAYYYFELNGFRVICLDTNYSYNPTKNIWEHNKTSSYGAPSGNKNDHSLGPVQEAWFYGVINDAADKDIPCIIFSHCGFSGKWTSIYNHAEIRSMIKDVNERNEGTVIAAFSGHLHTNRSAMIDGVFYMDVNTARNGCWIGNQTEHHYTTQTFDLGLYDTKGNYIKTTELEVNMLTQAKNTWFFTDPLSCIVTVGEDGTVAVEGSETTWLAGIAPPKDQSYIVPMISSGIYKADGKSDETK